METVQFEPMSVGRIFDRAFTIYRNNFLRFITIVAVIHVPVTLLSLASDSWVQTRTPARPANFFEQMRARYETRSGATTRDSSDAEPNPLGLFGKALVRLLEFVGAMLCQAALIKSVSETYLGHEITVGQAYRFILPKAWTLVAAALMVGLVTGLGFLLLIVPGVIFSVWFFLTNPAIVVEGHKASAGMTRSKALVAGNLGKVFAVGLLAVLLMIVAIMATGFFAGMLAQLLAPGNASINSFLVDLATTIGQLLIMPVSMAASILLYYDLRIRKEGFDLQMLAQSMMPGQGEFRAA